MEEAGTLCFYPDIERRTRSGRLRSIRLRVRRKPWCNKEPDTPAGRRSAWDKQGW